MRLALPLLLAGCCAISPASVNVIDGDTLRLADGQLVETVRVWGIDAPEMDQPGGKDARAELARLCGPPAPVKLERRGKDARGRTVARVWCGGEDAGLAMIASGHAWAYTRFSPPASYSDAQRAAIAAQRGIWRAGGAVPPWEWREKRQPRLPPTNGRCVTTESVALFVPGCDASTAPRDLGLEKQNGDPHSTEHRHRFARIDVGCSCRR